MAATAYPHKPRSDPMRQVRPSAIGSTLSSTSTPVRPSSARSSSHLNHHHNPSPLDDDARSQHRARGMPDVVGGVGQGGGGLRPRPSKRRGQTVPRSDPYISDGAGSTDGKRARRRKSNVEDSLLEERLKIANVVLPEDNLEDLVHLPIAPELVSRRRRLANGHPSNTSLASSFYSSSPLPSPMPPVPSPSLSSPTSPIPSSSSAPVLAPAAPTVGALSTSAPLQSRIPMTTRARAKSVGRRPSQDPSRRSPDPSAPPVPSPSAVLGPDENATTSGWETLQPAGGTSSSKPFASPPLPQPAVPRPVKKPFADVGSKSLPRPSPAPSSPQPGGHSARQRAATGNLGKKPPPSTAVTPRKASAPLPRATTPRRRPPDHRPRSLSVSSLPLDPPWVTDATPRLYRLAGQDGPPRHDDMILPAVARQLQKEKLAAEARAAEGGDWMVTEWDRDGNPKKIVRRPGVPSPPPAQPDFHTGPDGAAREPAPADEDAEEEEEEALSRRESVLGHPDAIRPAPRAHELGLPTTAPDEKHPDLDLSPLPTSRTHARHQQTQQEHHHHQQHSPRKEVWQDHPASGPNPARRRKDGVDDGHGGGCCRCVVM